MVKRVIVSFLILASLGVVFVAQGIGGVVANLSERGLNDNYVTLCEGWDGSGLGSADLTYYIENGTPDIIGEEAEIVRALHTWSLYADITWTEAASSGLSRSIDIKWAVGDHGCGWPFAVPGGALAHAFYPPPTSPEPNAGDIHFNDAFNWSRIDLFSVALHESGHSLGLDHSDNPNAVMYQHPDIVTGLHQDDIDAIRSLYASATPPLVILSLLAGINVDPVAFNLVYYDGVEVTLPTGTEPPELIAMYYYDPVALELLYYFPGWPSLMSRLEHGKVYLVIVSDACQWPIPQPQPYPQKPQDSHELLLSKGFSVEILHTKGVQPLSRSILTPLVWLYEGVMIE